MTDKCLAVAQHIVSEKGNASIERYVDGVPQYYCYGYIDRQTDELIPHCRNCKNNVMYADD